MIKLSQRSHICHSSAGPRLSLALSPILSLSLSGFYLSATFSLKNSLLIIPFLTLSFDLSLPRSRYSYLSVSLSLSHPSLSFPFSFYLLLPLSLSNCPVVSFLYLHRPSFVPVDVDHSFLHFSLLLVTLFYLFGFCLSLVFFLIISFSLSVSFASIPLRIQNRSFVMQKFVVKVR